MKTAFGLKHVYLVYKNSPRHCADEVCTNLVKPVSAPLTLTTRARPNRTVFAPNLFLPLCV